eukprot:TRINITY_DN43494_c0_g1_i1.p1 TRINITY_DN43494_c0_g1~~TRINITY_DN43494_c0_g1_i1.p1  ORF type:complete len:1059 (-),score=168.27 TRINITY_DN43494_c0_g1_i1:391-3567(-)
MAGAATSATAAKGDAIDGHRSSVSPSCSPERVDGRLESGAAAAGSQRIEPLRYEDLAADIKQVTARISAGVAQLSDPLGFARKAEAEAKSTFEDGERSEDLHEVRASQATHSEKSFGTGGPRIGRPYEPPKVKIDSPINSSDSDNSDCSEHGFRTGVSPSSSSSSSFSYNDPVDQFRLDLSSVGPIDENYDVASAHGAVHKLLESLNQDERLKVLGDLGTYFTERVGHLESEGKILSAKEVELDTAQMEMGRAAEMIKEGTHEHELKTLNAMHAYYSRLRGACGQILEDATTSSYKRLMQDVFRSDEEKTPEGIVYIEELREAVLSRCDDDTCEKSAEFLAQVKPSDLLALISTMQNEAKAMNDCLLLEVQRRRAYEHALRLLQDPAGQNPMGDPTVAEVLQEIHEWHTENSAGENNAKGSWEDCWAESERLQKDCNELRERIQAKDALLDAMTKSESRSVVTALDNVVTRFEHNGSPKHRDVSPWRSCMLLDKKVQDGFLSDFRRLQADHRVMEDHVVDFQALEKDANQSVSVLNDALSRFNDAMGQARKNLSIGVLKQEDVDDLLLFKELRRSNEQLEKKLAGDHTQCMARLHERELTLQSDIKNAKSRIEGLQEQLAAEQETRTALRAELEEMQDRVKAAAEKLQSKRASVSSAGLVEAQLNYAHARNLGLEVQQKALERKVNDTTKSHSRTVSSFEKVRESAKIIADHAKSQHPSDVGISLVTLESAELSGAQPPLEDDQVSSSGRTCTSPSNLSQPTSRSSFATALSRPVSPSSPPNHDDNEEAPEPKLDSADVSSHGSKSASSPSLSPVTGRIKPRDRIRQTLQRRRSHVNKRVDERTKVGVSSAKRPPIEKTVLEHIATLEAKVIDVYGLTSTDELERLIDEPEEDVPRVLKLRDDVAKAKRVLDKLAEHWRAAQDLARVAKEVSMKLVATPGGKEFMVAQRRVIERCGVALQEWRDDNPENLTEDKLMERLSKRNVPSLSSRLLPGNTSVANAANDRLANSNGKLKEQSADASVAAADFDSDKPPNVANDNASIESPSKTAVQELMSETE